MSPKRGTLSVSGRIYDRLQAYCMGQGVAMSALVEQLLEPVLVGDVAILATAEPAPAALDRSTLDAIAADRRNLALLRAVLPPRATGPVALDIPSHVAQDLEAQVERLSALGIAVEREQVFEAGINRMLDVMERVPWCRTCLEFIEYCDCRAKAAVR